MFPTITFPDCHGFLQTPSQSSSRRAFNPFTKFQRTIHSLNDSWQTYDIIFHGPRFDASGKLTRPERETVFHNGVLVQDNVELTGPTGHHVRPPYTPGPDKLPLALQDHNHPVRYRNIWIRELKSSE